jgi:hypothetical protein
MALAASGRARWGLESNAVYAGEGLATEAPPVVVAAIADTQAAEDVPVSSAIRRSKGIRR